jgi:hypothetical protein
MFKLVFFRLETQTDKVFVKFGASMAGGIADLQGTEQPSRQAPPCQFCVGQSISNSLFHLYAIL